MHGYAFGRRIVIECSGEIVFRGLEFQWRPAHARRKSGELCLALGVGANFEIELVKSSKSICDVDLHAGSIDGFGIRAYHRYFERATPEAAIDKIVNAGLTLRQVGLVPATIIGVVSDARFRSVRDPLQPIIYVMAKNGFTHIDVRYSGIVPNALREEIRSAWARLLPQVPFQGDFADDILREEYKAEIARGQLFAGFAFLSVVVGCLGLFGLAAFTAERRTKEIGIRKVLGARTSDIVRLLVWQFSRPVLIANMIAWPVAWWVMRDWLNRFDQRIGLGPTPFLLAGSLALGIAIATIASHAFRVARANPILALRYE